MIALVTDSNAQWPAELADEFEAAGVPVAVVPLSVVIDGKEYLEGVDLDADAFYGCFTSDSSPVVSTSQPSPGQFVAAYQRAIDAGATEIVSVHIGEALSGTCNSARLGAAQVGVPVRIVDTTVASFAIGCAVWAAADILRSGGSADDAVRAASEVGPRTTNAFLLGADSLARAGGRMDLPGDASPPSEGVPVYSLQGSDLVVVGHAFDVDAAADLFESFAVAHATAASPVRVGVGIADESTEPMWPAMVARLSGRPEVDRVVRYRVGPSAGAHTGPGTTGVVVAPSVNVP